MAEATVSIDTIINAFPAFDGKRNWDINAFIKQFDVLAEKTKIPQDLQAIILKGKIIGPARETMMDNEDVNAEINYDVFKEKLAKLFRKEESFEKSQNDFFNLKQEPNQSIDEFLKRFRAAANKYLKLSGFADKDGAKDFLKTIKLSRFLEQIRPDISFEIRKRGPKNLEDAIEIAKNVEAAMTSNNSAEINNLQSTSSDTKTIFEAILAISKTQTDNMNTLTAEINTLKLNYEKENANKNKTGGSFCMICEIKGHSIKDCYYNGKNKFNNPRRQQFSEENFQPEFQQAPTFLTPQVPVCHPAANCHVPYTSQNSSQNFTFNRNHYMPRGEGNTFQGEFYSTNYDTPQERQAQNQFYRNRTNYRRESNNQNSRSTRDRFPQWKTNQNYKFSKN